MATVEPMGPGAPNDQALQRFDEWAETSPTVGKWLEEAAAKARGGEDEGINP